MFKISFNYAQHHVCFINFSLNMFAKRQFFIEPQTTVCRGQSSLTLTYTTPDSGLT